MRTTGRKWSTEQKLAILKEAETNGVVLTRGSLVIGYVNKSILI